jgi:hypothetical protein
LVKPARKLFVEGGGDRNDALKTECRRAFTALLEKAGLQGRMPRIVACGGRQSAFDQFRTALGDRNPPDSAFLLVDAEEPVAREADPWQHVARRDGWDKPAGATPDHLHLMVQCMEAWFLADRRALQEFFGQGFRENALPSPTGALEEVGKPDLFRRLERATRDTATKGAYQKGRHSFPLLATLDPARLRAASPWSDRFFAALDRLME